MRARNLIYVAIVLFVFFVPYGAARATGYWSTSGKFDGSGTPITATGRDTAEIKGWMTFGEVSSGYGVSLAEIADAFRLPREEVTAGKALNKLESGEFSVTKLRAWLDARKSRAP
ncbi:MAG TPA: hypothetical protein VF960_08965 [Chloroflexota bacterium]